MSVMFRVSVWNWPSSTEIAHDCVSVKKECCAVSEISRR